MAKVKTQMDLVAEAWVKFERALYASKGTHALLCEAVGPGVCCG
jgi:hypothetical protein